MVGVLPCQGLAVLIENTINKALRKMGYDTTQDICGHGFRTLACSALIESGQWPEGAVERQMSHKESNRAAKIDATVVG